MGFDVGSIISRIQSSIQTPIQSNNNKLAQSLGTDSSISRRVNAALDSAGMKVNRNNPAHDVAMGESSSGDRGRAWLGTVSRAADDNLRAVASEQQRIISLFG